MSNQPDSPHRRLTGRQQIILQEIAAGREAREIATRLMLSIKTVEFHIQEIERRLGVEGTAAVVQAARRLGLLESDE